MCHLHGSLGSVLEQLEKERNCMDWLAQLTCKTLVMVVYVAATVACT